MGVGDPRGAAILEQDRNHDPALWMTRRNFSAFSDVRNLTGGILRWIDEVDRSQPKYRRLLPVRGQERFDGREAACERVVLLLQLLDGLNREQRELGVVHALVPLVVRAD